MSKIDGDSLVLWPDGTVGPACNALSVRLTGIQFGEIGYPWLVPSCEDMMR